MESWLIASVIKRHAKASSVFVIADTTTPHELSLSPGEELLAWYPRKSPDEETLYLTTHALWLVSESGVESLQWNEITGYRGPDSKELLLKDGDVMLTTTSGTRRVKMGWSGPNRRLVDATALMGIVQNLNK